MLGLKKGKGNSSKDGLRPTKKLSLRDTEHVTVAKGWENLKRCIASTVNEHFILWISTSNPQILTFPETIGKYTALRDLC